MIYEGNEAMLKRPAISKYLHRILLKSRNQNPTEVSNWFLELDIVLTSSFEKNLYRLFIFFGIIC